MAEGDRKKFSGRKLVSEAGDKSHVDNQSQSQSLSSDKQVDDKQTDGSGVQRLNKAVASTGYCSRRRADELIREGRVRVNGEKMSDCS
jgi:ribosomal protein S4